MAAATLAAGCALVAGTEPAGAGTFPGANGRIAFVTYDGTDTEIASMNPDGSEMTLLTENSPAAGGVDADDQRPAYSPDGERIVFTSNRDQPDREIWVMDANGENEVQLTDNAGDDNYPSFSPDGRRILFTSEAGGTGEEIFVMDTDGANATPLTNLTSTAVDPTFSPDGQRIAFVQYDGFDNEILAMDADGQNVVPLTNNAHADRRPNFSPDGQRIVFERDPAGPPTSDIFVMNADGQSQVPLPSTPMGDFNPVFSPDGMRIAFNTSGDDILVMDADGQNQTNLTNSPPDDAEPYWQPLNAPVCDLSGEAKQKSAKQVSATVTCSEDALVTATGTLTAPKAKRGASDSKSKQVPLGPVTVDVQPGVPAALVLAPDKKGNKLLKRAQKAGKKPKGSVSISAADDLGAQAADSFAVKLKPKKQKK